MFHKCLVHYTLFQSLNEGRHKEKSCCRLGSVTGMAGSFVAHTLGAKRGFSDQ